MQTIEERDALEKEEAEALLKHKYRLEDRKVSLCSCRVSQISLHIHQAAALEHMVLLFQAYRIALAFCSFVHGLVCLQ